MRLAGILRDSIVDGEGIRDVIFFQGCEHHCPGCHNTQTWQLDGGMEISTGAIANALKNSTNDVTISGGDPLLQPIALLSLCRQLRLQGKTIWLYTGYRFEDRSIEYWDSLMRWGVVALVDGRFEKDRADPKLKFRGSSNQRILNLRASVIYKRPVVCDFDNVED